MKLTPQSQYGILEAADLQEEHSFEVDPTESIWYILFRQRKNSKSVLKLTPQSQYGIQDVLEVRYESSFEVDSTESIWYRLFVFSSVPGMVLKLTPQSQYGIVASYFVIAKPPF